MSGKNESRRPGEARIRVGISSCLLGEAVRYDGGHKHNRYITGILGKVFDFISICPEVAIGLGIPRPSIRLYGDAAAPRAVGVTNPEVDVTERLDGYARSMAEPCRHLSGYVFKRGSPSCGIQGVKVFDPGGASSPTGKGIYARRLMAELPLMPVEEEGRLADPILRENFVTRVFVYRRWQDLAGTGVTPAGLVGFHTRHKMLIRSHSAAGYGRLGRLVANAGGANFSVIAGEYIALLMRTLERPATRRRHSDVLSHLAGYLKRDIDAGDKAELARLIEEYRLGRVPLVVPITLLKQHFRRCPGSYAGHQVYLDPHPEELQLRNFI